MTGGRKRLYLGKYIVLAVIALSVGCAVPFWYLSQEKRDEYLIKDLIRTLAENLSRTPEESTATALLKVKSIADAFTDPMSCAMGQYAAGEFDRERLIGSLTRYRAMVGKAVVSAGDITLEVTGKMSARVYFSGSFSGTLKSGMHDRIVKDIDAELVKLDGRWKIKQIKFTNVLH